MSSIFDIFAQDNSGASKTSIYICNVSRSTNFVSLLTDTIARWSFSFFLFATKKSIALLLYNILYSSPVYKILVTQKLFAISFELKRIRYFDRESHIDRTLSDFVTVWENECETVKENTRCVFFVTFRRAFSETGHEKIFDIFQARRMFLHARV